MINFIRLVRPKNLFLIIITMYGFGWFLEDFSICLSCGIKSLDFNLIVFSTILIAAAGNIINDYFDVKADRINKPERLIIDKYIKRRVAIFTHWILNLIAFIIAIYLSWHLNTFFYLFIHLLSINCLWYYSVYLKRRVLIGNIVFALLTALVPLLVGFYFYTEETNHTIYNYESIQPFELNTKINFILFISLILSLFAFTLNLGYEISKDIHDISVYKKLKYNTLAIYLGYKKTRLILMAILSITIVFSLVLFFFTIKNINIITLLPIIISGFFVLISLYKILMSKYKSDFKKISLYIELAIISGLINPTYWKLLLIYG